MLLKQNEIINGNYQVENLLGTGAFAEVYRVKHEFLGRKAMKVFRHPGATVAQTKEMMQEAVMLSKMGHRNIVRVFDAGVVETSIGKCGYFTMEYVAGGTLHDFWQSHGAIFVEIADAVEIIKQVCRGIAVAHSEDPPIIHRDIKTQNILVGYDMIGLRAIVSDFGLAKRVNRLTLLASSGGTIGFKPPEFLDNVDSCSADVWGIGVALYLLLTDRLPFPSKNHDGFIDKTCWQKPLTPMQAFNKRVDDSLETIVQKSLSIRPKDRYQNALSMLEDLEGWTPSEHRKYTKYSVTPSESKSALGVVKVETLRAPSKMVDGALKLSQYAGRLNDAADLLEQAINQEPNLRKKYEYQLKLWRSGVVM